MPIDGPSAEYKNDISMFQFLGLSLSSLIIFVFMRLQKKPEEVAWLDVPVDDLLVMQVL